MKKKNIEEVPRLNGCAFKERRMQFAYGLSAVLLTFSLSTAPAMGAQESPVLAIEDVQQAHTVSGQVLDERGEPMIGVSVRVKGFNQGVITDLDGNFKLNVPAGGKEIQLSYVGYQTKSVAIEDSRMTIRMEPDNNMLDEVVAIGYAKVKRKDLTGQPPL